VLRRALVLTAVALIAAPAAVAKSGKWSYGGEVYLEPESRVSFDVVRKKRGGKKKVKNAFVENVFAGCGDSISTISTPIPTKATLKKGGKGFKLNAIGPLQELHVSGKVTARGKKAYGTLHLKGSFVVDGETKSCDTGPRNWTAKLTSGP
jgi:hypothetical protein